MPEVSESAWKKIAIGVAIPVLSAIAVYLFQPAMVVGWFVAAWGLIVASARALVGWFETSTPLWLLPVVALAAIGGTRFVMRLGTAVPVAPPVSRLELDVLQLLGVADGQAIDDAFIQNVFEIRALEVDQAIEHLARRGLIDVRQSYEGRMTTLTSRGRDYVLSLRMHEHADLRRLLCVDTKHARQSRHLRRRGRRGRGDPRRCPLAPVAVARASI
jgi:hypothetical protein